MLLGEGRGLRLRKGVWAWTIHHCMRCIGLAERALEPCANGCKQEWPSEGASRQGTIRAGIAESRMEIEQARLLTLKAAHLMDTVGNKAARAEIAMIKVVAPNVALRVLDRAIQAYGRPEFRRTRSWLAPGQWLERCDWPMGRMNPCRIDCEEGVGESQEN